MLAASQAVALPPATHPQLETIFVSAPTHEVMGSISETHHSLNMERIKNLGASSSAEIVRRLPSAQVSTNSRGETLVNLRGAGERQVTVFFDGAPLNTAWDNRLDIKVIPASVIRRAVSTAGALSPQYGVNALGAVALFAHERSPGGPRFEAAVMGGAQSQYGGDLKASGVFNEWSLLGAGGIYSRDGFSLSANADLPYSQASGEVRTNTDLRRVYGLVRVSREMEAGQINLSVLMSEMESGVAPEGHSETGARFWRYPVVKMLQSILSGEFDLTPAQDVSYSFWIQRFDQTISSYAGVDYAIVDSSEQGADTTFGGRAIWRGEWNRMLYSLSCSAMTAEHKQRIFDFAGGAAPNASAPVEVFAQNTASVGVEVERFVTDRLTAKAGIGLDYIDYVKTAGRPASPAYFEPVLSMALAYELSDELRVRAAAGRKSRMPTMRELFSTALDRFLINPDLLAETLSTVEVGAEYQKDGLRISAIAFAQDVNNTIDQRRVGGRRQRVNLEGSTVMGVELAGAADLNEFWTVSGALTASQIRRKTTRGDESGLLAERPAVLANLLISRSFVNGARIGAEIEHRGRAYSPDESGAFVPLEVSTQLNLSASLPVGSSAEIYINVDNLTDALIEPQIGLPAPGRSVRGGFRVSLP